MSKNKSQPTAKQKNEILALFRKELPEIMIGDRTVKTILSDKKNHFIFRMESEQLIGCSLINENAIYLLLVDGNYQGRGIGTSLLKESEEYIEAKGFNSVVLGVGADYIMPGVPMIKNAHQFFEKSGYHHSWGDERCIDLSMSLKDFIYSYKPGDTVDGILYRFANESDMYKPDSSDPVIVAEKDGEIIAALMIGTESEKKKLGYAGCIITAPNHRGKGIATNILKIGTNHMKNIGLKDVWLSYTYSQIVNTYIRAGYSICMEYFMGEKEI